MSYISNLMKSTAGAIALASAFNVSGADLNAKESAAHPLLEPSAKVLHVSEVRQAIRNAYSGDPVSASRASGFLIKLHSKLSSPLDRPQMVYFPTKEDTKLDREVGQNEMVVGTVIPPGVLYPVSSVPVCSDVAGSVMVKGEILTNGRFVPDLSPNPAPAPSSQFRACRGWLLEKGKDMVVLANKVKENPALLGELQKQQLAK